MKFWFDTTPVVQHSTQNDDWDYDLPYILANECGDCGLTNSYSSYFSLPISEENTSYFQTYTLQQSTSLYCQFCDDNQWLVCNPTQTGSVTVVDAQALALLERFRTPMTLHEAEQTNLDASPSSFKKSTALFYQLGFLQNAQQSSPRYEWNESQTLSAWLHVTNACNLRCNYCYLDKTNEHMTDATAQRAVDAIFRSAQKQNFQGISLKYAGGEASLYLSHLLEIHDYAAGKAQQRGLAFRAHIHSNGVVLSQRTIEQFKARHIGVTISLDGVGAAHDTQRPFINGHGSFKYVDRTITRLLANGIVPHITVTVSQRNLDGLLDLMQYILERNMTFNLSYYRDNDCSTHIRDLQFTDTQMIEGMEKVFAFLEHNLPRQRLLDSLIDKASLSGAHRHICGVGRNYLVIDQDGGVAKCQADIKRRVTTIDTDDPLQAVRDDRSGIQSLSVEEKEGCRTCQWRYWCAGGCPLLTYRMSGRYDVKSPNCNIYKALFPQALRLEALRLLKYETPIVF